MPDVHDRPGPLPDSAPAGFTIRPALLSEGAALDAICRRSKAHWGYDPAFLAAAAPLLAIPAAAIRAGRVLVAEGNDGSPLGVAAWAPLPGHGRAAPTHDLSHLFVAPEAFGRGIGRALFRAAMAQAAGQGARLVTILADPHACGFYERLGARRVGAEASALDPERLLPLYEYVPPPGPGPIDPGQGGRGST